MDLSSTHIILGVLGLLGGGLGTFVINLYISKRDKDLQIDQQKATQKLAADDKAMNAYDKLFETILQWSNKCDKNNDLIIASMTQLDAGFTNMSNKLDQVLTHLTTTFPKP